MRKKDDGGGGGGGGVVVFFILGGGCGGGFYTSACVESRASSKVKRATQNAAYMPSCIRYLNPMVLCNTW
jgi:hypothetical protein